MRIRSVVARPAAPALRGGGYGLRGRATAIVLAAGAVCAGGPGAAEAGVSVLRPPREATTLTPLEVTLVYSGDEANPVAFDVPDHLEVALTNGDVPPRRLTLIREPGAPAQLSLASGEMKTVRYAAPWPDWARGAMRIDVPGMDVSPSVVLLTRKPAAVAGASQQAAVTGAQAAPVALAAPSAGAVAAASANAPLPDLGGFLGGRLSTFEPMYFADGGGTESLVRFQLSFKYRLVLPDDPRSRGLLDNLYFAYTQMSLWDIHKTGAPFRDTSYMPQLFYYLPDTGWKSPLFTQMGLMAGLGHESNGQGGADSRGIDIVFVRPTWEFGDVQSTHLTLSPKIYYYIRKDDLNSDIAHYRGYADFLVKYGSPDGLQLAVTLRKGTRAGYGSIDTQLTYPLARLFSNALGGYLWLGYFNGYGEDLLDYNQRRWVARIGLSLVR